MQMQTNVQVFVDGHVVGYLDRNTGPRVRIGLIIVPGGSAILDILVEAVGRSNQGWRYDTKGLVSPNVTLDGVQCPVSPSVCKMVCHLTC